MKKIFSKYIYIIAAAMTVLTGCNDDDVLIGSVDTSRLEAPDTPVAYVTSADGKRAFSLVELHDNLTTQLVVNMPKATNSDCRVSFVYDPSVLVEYNEQHGTDFNAFPEANVSFDNNGTAVLPAGSNMVSVDYTLTSNGDVEPGTVLALPLRVSIEGNASLGKGDQSRVILIKDLSAYPDITKYVEDEDGNLVPGVKMFSCMEVNNVNPLNNLCFTLKGSGKLMFDYVVLFSANINYNPVTGRVYVFNNPNVQALLDNREKLVG